MSTNAIATAVVAKAAGVTGMRGGSAVELDTIPASPYAMLGDHRGRVEPGNWERLTYEYPLHVYVERNSNAPRTSTAVNDLLDALIAAYRTGIQLGATVAQSVVTDWNTDAYATVGGTEYQVIEMTVEVTVAQGRSYTA